MEEEKMLPADTRRTISGKGQTNLLTPEEWAASGGSERMVAQSRGQTQVTVLCWGECCGRGRLLPPRCLQILRVYSWSPGQDRARSPVSGC